MLFDDEPSSQIKYYTCLIIDIWTQRCRCTSTQFYVLWCHLLKMASFQSNWRQFFLLSYGHPWLAGKRLVRAMQCTQFHAKNVKNDLKSADFLKRNFLFWNEGSIFGSEWWEESLWALIGWYRERVEGIRVYLVVCVRVWECRRHRRWVCGGHARVLT